MSYCLGEEDAGQLKWQGFFRIALTVNVFVENDDGRESTSAKARDDFEREIAIFCGALVFGKPEIGTQSVHDGRRAFDVTSSPIATSDDVFAFGFECEVRIKRRDAVDFI